MPEIMVKLARPKPTVAFDTYWNFAAERQRILIQRLKGQQPPWTDDWILRRYRFTNAYRAADRVSQFLISSVIPAGERTPRETLFRIVLFKIFNKIETWEFLCSQFGTPSWSAFDFHALVASLSAAQESSGIYSAAYIMPPLNSTRPKHAGHLDLLRSLMTSDFVERCWAASNLHDVYHLLRQWPLMGRFLALQFATDLSYAECADFEEMRFVIAGPGAMRGIAKCFSDLGDLSAADVIRMVADLQESEFSKRGLDFEKLNERRLQLIDCQNLFCELDKYARLRHPDLPTTTRSQRPKQLFRPRAEAIQFCAPPSWGRNDRSHRN